MSMESVNGTERRGKNSFACVAAALALTMISALATLLSAGMYLFYCFYFSFDGYMAACVFGFIAGALTLAAFGWGVKSVKKCAHYAVYSAILCMASAVIMFGCISIPKSFYISILSAYCCLIAGILDVVSFALFAVFREKRGKSVCTTAENMSACDRKIAKISFKRLIALPLLISAAALAVAIPCIMFSSYAVAYHSLERSMGHFSGYMCACMNNIPLYLDILPDGYKDVADIKIDYYIFGENRGIIYSDRTSCDEKRAAYRKMAQIATSDPRWSIEESAYFYIRLLMGAEFLSDNYSLKVQENAHYDYDLQFETDMPCDLTPEAIADLKCDIWEYYDVTCIWGYSTDNGHGSGIGNKKYPVFKIEEFIYSYAEDTYSIKVYCFKTEETFVMTMQK